VGFREAMSRLPSGVVIVTCRVEGRAWGITVSSCSSVSLEPPVLAVSLTRGTVSATEIERAGAFGVSILGAGLVGMARFGAVRGQAKFIDGTWKVNKALFCTLLGLAGQTPPACAQQP
jgi:flavin reductase (DIM6/NTAB) family NADH-FMN oxidoreductase RutF